MTATLAATFKNSDVSVQSPAKAWSLLFEQHRGDSAALMLGDGDEDEEGTTLLVLAIVAAATTLTACSHAMMMIHGTGARRPAASEFGLGPRTSASGRSVATLEPAMPLRTRLMQTVRVIVCDAEGHAVDEARVSIDGGMPQHGHGLSTRPRVTKSFGDGIYEIEGVRFNMGGWWEFKPAIAGSRGEDTVERGGTSDGRGGSVEDEFNCRSGWSDASQECAELEFL